MHIYPQPVTSKQGGLHKQGDRNTNGGADEGQEGGMTAWLKVKKEEREDEEEEREEEKKKKKAETIKESSLTNPRENGPATM